MKHWALLLLTGCTTATSATIASSQLDGAVVLQEPISTDAGSCQYDVSAPGPTVGWCQSLDWMPSDDLCAACGHPGYAYECIDGGPSLTGCVNMRGGLFCCPTLACVRSYIDDVMCPKDRPIGYACPGQADGGVSPGPGTDCVTSPDPDGGAKFEHNYHTCCATP